MRFATPLFALAATTLLPFVVCVASERGQHARGVRQAAHVSSIALAVDNSGKAGTRVDAFAPSDNPMHFVVALDKKAAGTRIRAALMAVIVETGEEDVRVADVERVTGESDNELDVTMTLPRDWPVGAYRLDVFVNGKLDRSRLFLITCPRTSPRPRGQDQVSRRSRVGY